MDLEQLQRDLRNYYKHLEGGNYSERIDALLAYLEEEHGLGAAELSQPEIQLIAKIVLDFETASLHDALEELLVQKERIDRQVERKTEQLQEEKHAVFNALESAFGETTEEAVARLHQVKLQSIDLFDMLEEMVETAIITTLEKTLEIEETIEEISKEITYETLSEGPLETGRIRRVLGSILHSAVGVGEAAPNQAEAILRGTLRGIRSGLVKSIRRLKKQLLFMPEELRLTESMQTELLRTDHLFTQIVLEEALRCDDESRDLLEKLLKEIRYDMGELVEVSKEAVDLMKIQLSQVLQRSQMLNSKTASEAKRMGVSAWMSAKSALGDALQNAKEKIEKK